MSIGVPYPIQLPPVVCFLQLRPGFLPLLARCFSFSLSLGLSLVVSATTDHSQWNGATQSVLRRDCRRQTVWEDHHGGWQLFVLAVFTGLFRPTIRTAFVNIQKPGMTRRG